MLLNVHSHYSLRYGTLSPERLIDGLIASGYETAVLTDINNSSAVLDFIHKAQDSGFNGLAGVEFRNGDELLYIGISRNPAGFRELNELLTVAHRDNQPYPMVPPPMNDVFIVYPYGKKTARELQDHEYIGIKAGQVNKILLDPAYDKARYVILHPVTFHPDEYKLHIQLRAIDNNLLISQLEPQQMAGGDEIMIPMEALKQRYARVPELLRNTRQLLAQCSFNFDFKAVKNKQCFTGERYADKELLLQYTMEGFYKRYGPHNTEALQRVQKELQIINDLQFNAYFLITDDICRFARSNQFHYVGRGSGANSIVAYSLGITDVDPVALSLYFERFLNPKRKTPPDFDIDFSWNERDTIYKYIFNKYPKGNVALMGTMSTFRSRSIIRELGKIYGLPKADIDRLVHDPHNSLNKNEVTELIYSVYNQMEDLPNQRSIHASGVLISELPLTHYCALDYPPKALPTTQFDMYTAEDIAFEKFDILSQRGIGHIRDCREIIRLNKGEIVRTDEPERLFQDEQIAAQLRSANSIGCFYIESPAMRQLLGKLQCDNYATLVAASSIIRPGVASSGMMKAYIERHHDPATAVYPHPVFKEQLEETYGIMVYQEDVMKIGHYYGGLDLADADVLRRMMSGKSRDDKAMRLIEQRFFDHCRASGYPEGVSREIWRQMESFAGFSFNKAHSASFAVESYQSLFLKTYYPLEFMVAVLNNYGGFYRRKVYVGEAQKNGAHICLPCVNKSQYNTSIRGMDIYLGYDGILNLEQELAQFIPIEQQRNGNYTSLENFLLRTGAGLEQLILLIRCGAFRFTGMGKKELLWEAHLLCNERRGREAANLFDAPFRKPVLPRLDSCLLEDIYDEIELLGFPVSASAFDLLKSDYRGTATAKDLPTLEGETVRIVADFVCDKKVHTRNGQLMKFGTFKDEAGEFIDTVHFPPQLKAYPLQGEGIYLIQGKVVCDFGCPAIEVEKCARMPLKADPRSE